MAKWLNVLLAGPCTVSVFRDGVDVTSTLADVGASLSTAGGVVTLDTPADENHQWSVTVSPDYLSTASKYRMRSFDFTDTLASADASSGSQSISLTVPAGTPDPATFSSFGSSMALALTEEAPA